MYIIYVFNVCVYYVQTCFVDISQNHLLKAILQISFKSIYIPQVNSVHGSMTETA